MKRFTTLFTTTVLFTTLFTTTAHAAQSFDEALAKLKAKYALIDKRNELKETQKQEREALKNKQKAERDSLKAAK